MHYKCYLCDFETIRLSNFTRHMESKKHIKNNLASLNVDKKTVEKILSNDKLTCANCGATFMHRQGLYKHKKENCKNTFNKLTPDKDIECYSSTSGISSDTNLDNEISIKSKKVIKSAKYDKSRKSGTIIIDKDVLAEKDNEIKELKKQNEKLVDALSKNADTFNKTADTSNKSISIMKFAIKNFANAPPIKQLPKKEIMKMITYEEKTNTSKRPTVEILLFHFLQKRLYKFVGDIILNFYKKASPEEQSVWNADVARLSFIVKQVIGEDGESEWVSDKSGIKVSTIIINPLYDIIKEMMINYVETSDEIINENSDTNDGKILDLLKNMTIANDVIKFINLNDVQQDTLKYIAPYFGFDRVSLKIGTKK